MSISENNSSKKNLELMGGGIWAKQLSAKVKSMSSLESAGRRLGEFRCAYAGRR